LLIHNLFFYLYVIILFAKLWILRVLSKIKTNEYLSETKQFLIFSLSLHHLYQGNAMYILSDFLPRVMGFESSPRTQLGIYCMEVGASESFYWNKIMGRCACNVIVLVTRGTLALRYDEQELVLKANDLFVYVPGMTSHIHSASADYHAFCLLTDEDYTLDTPAARSIIRAAYLSTVHQYTPVFSLPEGHARHLEELMRSIIRYIESEHLYKKQALRMSYSLFLLDVMDAQQHAKVVMKLPGHAEDIFIDFMKLLREHYAIHHDIAFYASQLHISTTYLSRIVKQVSGRTVVHHINQLVVMEAAWLLQQSDLSIEQISNKLNFATQSSFTKFFTRMKGAPPMVYRKQVSE